MQINMQILVLIFFAFDSTVCLESNFTCQLHMHVTHLHLPQQTNHDIQGVRWLDPSTNMAV